MSATTTDAVAAASVILRNARIEGGLVDVRIDEGVVTRISAVIPATDLPERDVDGRWLVPGLWDEHVHFTQWTLTSSRLDLGAADTAASVAAIVEREAAATPESRAPIVGYGFRDALWPELAHRSLLDAATDRPVVLVSGDLHCAWVNTAALAWLDLADLDDAATSTGLLREEDAWAAFERIDSLDPAELDVRAIAAGRRAAARGVVGFVDLEMDDNAATWARRIGAGFDTQRVEIGIYSAQLDAALAAGFRDGEPIPGGGGLVTVGPFKVITDGSLNTRTAYCSFPYPDLVGTPDETGLLTVPLEELTALMTRAHAGGLRCAIHAIGDRANTLALDAFAATGARGSIEHAQLVDPADIERFARLGVVASVQPEHAMDDRDIADGLWAGHTHDAFPLSALVASGARLQLGSDAPVAPLDPWISLAAAVTRSRDGREPWHAEQRLEASDALAASARGRTMVRRGDVADIAIVERSPLEADPDALRTTIVAATLLGGRFTHDAL